MLICNRTLPCKSVPVNSAHWFLADFYITLCALLSFPLECSIVPEEEQQAVKSCLGEYATSYATAAAHTNVPSMWVLKSPRKPMYQRE
jgi:hypothetical protein